MSHVCTWRFLFFPTITLTCFLCPHPSWEHQGISPMVIFLPALPLFLRLLKLMYANLELDRVILTLPYRSFSFLWKTTQGFDICDSNFLISSSSLLIANMTFFENGIPNVNDYWLWLFQGERLMVLIYSLSRSLNSMLTRFCGSKWGWYQILVICSQ